MTNSPSGKQRTRPGTRLVKEAEVADYIVKRLCVGIGTYLKTVLLRNDDEKLVRQLLDPHEGTVKKLYGLLNS